MGVQERRARERNELRQDILDAARDLFLSEGYEHVSMRKIAQRIEYSPTTIYLHFADKDDLLDSLCAEALGKLVERMEIIDRQGGDALTRLRNGLRAYVEFGLENPQHYMLTFVAAPAPRGPDEFTRRQAMGKQAFDGLRRAVQACVDAKAFRPLDVEVTSQVIWAALHGLTALLISRPCFPWADRDQLVNTLVSMQLEGLKP